MKNKNPLVESHSTLNPYRTGIGQILRRARWDLRLESWISRRKLIGIQNKYIGQTAVVLCNGPSLNEVDFDLLKDRCYVFGLNKINLLFERTNFRPNCIVAVNPFVIDQNKDFYNETSIDLYLDSVAFTKRMVRPAETRTFLHSAAITGFAKDCSVSIDQGHTVTYVALQLAFHMGFERVALVGADHSFATKGPANMTVLAGEKDESHFDPSYFSGVQWQLPDLFESEAAYVRAKRMYEAYGRHIYNCSVGGKLEVFDRFSIGEFLKNANP